MVAWLLLGAGSGAVLAAAPEGSDALEAGFRDPPPAARPGAYWCWLNGVFDRRHMTRDLEEMKDKGLAKAYIFDVGARDLAKIIPAGPEFMGPESLDAIVHAEREARRLGLELGLITSSSWNAGGPWVEPRDASMALYHVELPVAGPGRFERELPFPPLPKSVPRGEDGLPVFWRHVALLAFPVSEIPPEDDAEAKRRGADDAAPAEGETKPKPAPKGWVERVESVVDLSDRVDAAGRLVWDVPPGKWRLLRLVSANTGEGLKLPSPNSHGLAIDHFSAEATRRHFQVFIDRLRARLGPLDRTALTTLYVCSYELRGSTWTPALLDEFRRRRGYDMTPYLPVLFGYRVENAERTERFEYDYRKTLGELLVDHFYRAAADVCREHGLKLCAEAGGPGPPLHQVPVDALQALGALDIPRGEFWHERERREKDLWVVKETACAAHIYGKPVVDMEALTSWRHWLDGPGDLKPTTDRAFCEGANLMTFHTFAHSPPQAGLPGWVYHAGTQINPNLVWWSKARAFVDYLARCSFLLQEGLFVGDVCYYYGDQGFNFVPPKHVDPSLGPGFDYDVVNAEVMLTRMDARDGRIVLPDGMSYALLVLPERDDIDLDVLRKIEDLVRRGATVVGPKPSRSTGLAGYPGRDEEVARLAERLWGPCDGKSVLEHKSGEGKIVWGRTLRDVLAERGIGPDFTFTSGTPEAALDFIHRRTGETDIYFVRNCTVEWTRAECVFRADGRQPELWLPDTGEMRLLDEFEPVEAGTRVPLRLAPHETVFVVFRAAAKEGAGRPGFRLVEDDAAAVEIEGPWEVAFPEGRGAPPKRTFEKLACWTQHDDEGIRHFSGIATYRATFTLPDDEAAMQGRWLLDLGRVGKVADAVLNDRRLGVLWKTPYRVEVTGTLRPGENRLVVEVANTWANRLVGDAQSADGKRYTATNMDKSLTWTAPWKETPLLPSGLMGPVRLVPLREDPNP